MLIEEYLESLQESGCAAKTISAYRTKLNQLYQHLPKDKYIYVGTLDAWRDTLLEQATQTAPSTAVRPPRTG